MWPPYAALTRVASAGYASKGSRFVGEAFCALWDAIREKPPLMLDHALKLLAPQGNAAPKQLLPSPSQKKSDKKGGANELTVTEAETKKTFFARRKKLGALKELTPLQRRMQSGDF